MSSTAYDELMKIPRTVSVPEETWAMVDAAVQRGEAPSVSAFVADALASATEALTLREFLDEWFADIGPPTASELAWADKVLGFDD